jgi:hypothetical protein
VPRALPSPLLWLPLAALHAGCALSLQHVGAPVPRLAPPECGVAFVCDGVGDFGATTDALKSAFAECRVPLRVEEVQWSHGFLRVFSDQLDYPRIHRAAACLTCAVRRHLQAYPGSKVYLVGHSAGSAVTLLAAGQLPPDSVERIVLLAPAVSAYYDLRPALRCARRGVDAFVSERDRFYLGAVVAALGTTDRTGCPAAGRVGFEPVVGCPADALLYAKLRHHPWTPSVLWTGNRGGHFATYQPVYLRYYVLPLFR